MANLIDYIKWRGDINFSISKFNEVDNMAFERFSYFPLEKLIEEDEKITIKEVGRRFLNKNIDELSIIWPADIDLLPLMASSQRYNLFEVSDFKYVFDRKNEEQFAAIVIHISDDEIYISYRGTDSTVVGWKEDFNLGFMSNVGSQVSAKKYLEYIANKYPNKKIIVGGHSKGGNLAVYASIFVSKEIRDRIICVYNNEGPGFEKKIIELPEYMEMKERIKTYIPQNSIIGRVMNHLEDMIIVESDAKGIMQHDIYSWQVNKNEIIRAEGLTSESEFIDKTVTGWLENVDADKREVVIDAIFDIIYKTDVNTFKELKENKFDNMVTMIKSYNGLDNDTKEMILESAKTIAKLAKNNAPNIFKK